GYGGELMRSEEAAKAIVALGNTAKLDGKDGIEIIPNNVSGTLHTPTMHVVADNVLENTGLVSAPTLGYGIALHTYASVTGYVDAAGESVMHDNVSSGWAQAYSLHWGMYRNLVHHNVAVDCAVVNEVPVHAPIDRKSTRLNSSHVKISYAVFCLKKKKNKKN